MRRAHIDSFAITERSITDNYTNILKQDDLELIFSIGGNGAYLNYVKDCRRKAEVAAEKERIKTALKAS